MYSSNSNVTNSNSYSHYYSTSTALNVDQFSKQDDLLLPSSSNFFYFPSPPPYIFYEDDAVGVDLHQQQQEENLLVQQPVMPETQEAAPAAAPPPATAPAPAPATAPAPDVMPNNNQQLRCQMISLMEQQKLQQQVIPKKRTPKKDRHSKIQTAHGPRDRRMRLSLGVAREFFNLQDLLKFDKASKTVEWLLIQSRPAIKQLRKGLIDPHLKHSNSSVVDANSASSISECEVVSSGSIDDSCPELIRTVKGRTSTNSSAKAKKLKSGSGRASRKSAFHHPFAKESREKARARARERTRNIEKQRQQLYQESKLSSASVASDRDNTKPWTSPFEFEKGEEESGTQQSRNNNNIIVNNPHLDDQVLADVDEFTSSIIFSYDPHNTTPASQEHQFPNFQVYGKPWEAYNNCI